MDGRRNAYVIVEREDEVEKKDEGGATLSTEWWT